MAEDTPPPRRNGLHPTAHTTRGGGPGLHPIAHTTRGGGPGRRRWILVGAAAAIVLGVGVTWWYYSGRESTDDAQIEGHITQISARLSGTIIKVNVTDNESVAAGTILAQIDPHDYQVAVDRVGAELADAEANAAAAGTGVPVTAVSTRSDIRTATGALEEAESGVTVADRQVEAAQAQLVAAQARMREQEATALKNTRDVERWKPLVAKEEISQQQFDAAVAAAEAARAAADAATSDAAAAQTAVAVAQQRAVQARAVVARAQAALQAAKTAPEQVEITKARAASADARVKQARATLAQAELNLERTSIKAPTSGIVSRKAVEVGQLVQPGQPLLALVSLDDVWVIANFKETQLDEVRVGQRARVEVDALGGRDFNGHVDSIAAATGARFSLLPPENATGNFVKVVQRVPVKIVFEPGQDPNHMLRPGMSVIPTVFVKSQ
jgi:membrane fusion protein (multidrug efflux system)